MKILLVRPNLPSGINIVPQAAPPMGLMYLASYLLKERPSDEVKIIDSVVDHMDARDIERAARQFGPDIVGISSMSIHAPVMHEIATKVKAILPESTIIAGGPHAAAAPASILADHNIDIVVPGEGEATFLELVDVIENGGDMEKVAGLILRDETEGIKRTAARAPIEDLDSIPFPAWDLVGIDKFFDYAVLTQNNVRAHPRFTTIFTSRACPYRCIYCHNIFGKRFRPRGVSNVLEEMAVLHDRYGVREFHLIDDCFNLDLERASEIMRGIIDRGWDIKMAFPNGVRADRLPQDYLDLMKSAGVYKMNYGVESGTRRIQALMNKNLDLNLIKNSIDRSDRTGFITHGFFMVGFPTETCEEMLETVEFACSSRLTMAGFFFVQPYPGTALYEMAISHGWCPPDIVGDEGCFNDLGINVSAATDKQLDGIQSNAYRRFYLNPFRMARLFSYLPRKLDFWEQAVAHWKVKFL